MKFHFFEPRAEAHIRKSLEYLAEANLAWVEHQAAAEHHNALAKMYAERIARIETEINNTRQPRSMLTRQSDEETRSDDERPKTDSVVVYPSRTTRS